MRSLYDDYKLAEMMYPTRNPRPPRGTLGAASATPVFLDPNGIPITSIVCGGSYTFDVPGYHQIWLTMMKDGTKVFDQLFSVPMPSYQSSCVNDIGTYQVIALDPITGIVLGQTAFQVLAADGSAQGGFFASLSSTQLLIGGAALLYLLTRKKGRK